MSNPRTLFWTSSKICNSRNIHFIIFWSLIAEEWTLNYRSLAIEYRWYFASIFIAMIFVTLSKHDCGAFLLTWTAWNNRKLWRRSAAKLPAQEGKGCSWTIHWHQMYTSLSSRRTWDRKKANVCQTKVVLPLLHWFCKRQFTFIFLSPLFYPRLRNAFFQVL